MQEAARSAFAQCATAERSAGPAGLSAFRLQLKEVGAGWADSPGRRPVAGGGAVRGQLTRTPLAER